jgi:Asp-tRNA(Asn)/Glu-tRNA(Gln) amidotransferase C subunit
MASRTKAERKIKDMATLAATGMTLRQLHERLTRLMEMNDALHTFKTENGLDEPNANDLPITVYRHDVKRRKLVGKMYPVSYVTGDPQRPDDFEGLVNQICVWDDQEFA